MRNKSLLVSAGLMLRLAASVQVLAVLISCGGSSNSGDSSPDKPSSPILAPEIPAAPADPNVDDPAACETANYGGLIRSATLSCSPSPSLPTGPVISPPVPPVPPGPPDPTILPVPTLLVGDYETVDLQCGTIYHGTLNLANRSGVQVRTVGNCGKAVISPAKQVIGWTRHSGNIYSAPIGFIPKQVVINGNPVALAHWPNVPWARDASSIPSSDLDGATLVYLEDNSVIKSEVIDQSQVSVHAVRNNKPFYLEGKLWMLDSPGEWAVQNNVLYLWTSDGRLPEKVWAAPASDAINADDSYGVTINGVKISMAFNGISANRSFRLKVLNSEIDNSAQDGIWASGSRNMLVDNTKVSNSRRNGIDGWFSITNAIVRNSSVDNTGMNNMPTPSYAGIFFGGGSGNQIDNVRVTNSSYHGIAVIQNMNTSVTNSFVDTACQRLTDCGGIYTYSRNRSKLNLLIENNTVTNVIAHDGQGMGIYLDDSSNYVTVTRNRIINNSRGMMVHSGFKNEITHNTFISSALMHMAFPQDSTEKRIEENVVQHNIFHTTRGEQTFNLSYGTEEEMKSFGIFDYNTYISATPQVFARTYDRVNGVTHSYSSWKDWSSQDKNSAFSAPH